MRRLAWLTPGCLARVLAVTGLALLCVPMAWALERITIRDNDSPAIDWQTGGPQTISYYNTCTGWIWAWEMLDGMRYGVRFDTQAEGTQILTESVLRFSGRTPPGYGYTGTIAIYDADEQTCPVGTPISSQSFLPHHGFNTYAWSVPVPQEFWILTTVGYSITPTYYIANAVTDHPSPGPTGSAPCGSCFPADREARSFYFGTANSPLCPGRLLYDGWCDAELVWTVALDVPVGVSSTIETKSWTGIKNLYR